MGNGSLDGPLVVVFAHDSGSESRRRPVGNRNRRRHLRVGCRISVDADRGDPGRIVSTTHDKSRHNQHARGGRCVGEGKTCQRHEATSGHLHVVAHRRLRNNPLPRARGLGHAVRSREREAQRFSVAHQAGTLASPEQRGLGIQQFDECRCRSDANRRHGETGIARGGHSSNFTPTDPVTLTA